MNFKEQFKKGLAGLNFGLPTGLIAIDKVIGGIQRAAIYGIAAGPKVGKTTLVDYSFVISPFLYLLEEIKKGNPKNLSIEWIYFSFEINRVRKEFKYVTYFMYRDYGINEFSHKKEVYPITPSYLEGKMKDNDGDTIIPCEEHQKIVMAIYEKRIIPLFGEFDNKGKQIKKGMITFVENRENPTGLRNFIGEYSGRNGTWKKSQYLTVVGTDGDGKPIKKMMDKREAWIPNDPNKYTIIVTDHLRKLPSERGFNPKQTIDKMIEYQVEFRNWCGFTFVDIIHLNRWSDTARLKYNNEFIYPTGDDVKETGNLSEEADFLFTMMNPNDDKYNLKKHFGLDIKNTSNDEIYPGYISIHLVESRESECPAHFRSIMKGNVGAFEPLIEKSGYGY